ncbi:MAG: hypothetical protein J6R27_04690 [Muribaculaceae bacterium]|nr:hypothetical protein [Muribaculaceae bacterium]
MKIDQHKKAWYVVRVHNMSFDRTRRRLEELGFEIFIPEYFDIIILNGKKVKSLIPALKDIFFIYATYDQIERLITQQKLPLKFYYSHCSHIQNDALWVREEDMKMFMLALKELDRKPMIHAYNDLNLSAGQYVRILSGQFEGVEGYCLQLVRGQRKRLVLTLGNLISVSLILNPDDLIEQLPSPTQP